MTKRSTTTTLKNIPRYVAEEAIRSKRFTAAQLATIDEKIYRYFTPDWSEDSWSTTWRYFRDTLSLAAEQPSTSEPADWL